jgi:putative chitinase
MTFQFQFTPDHLKQMIGNNPHLNHWHKAISTICPDYGIDTPKRLAAFVAQCAHESANFTALRENLNYRAESLMKTWPRRFPTLAEAQQYARNPEKIANKVYADRMGNGPESTGDGWRYLGRGLIQLTGKENYSWFGASIGVTDPQELVEFLGTFEGAVQSACWFWETNELNQWADKGDMKTLTKRINGGTIGLADRIKHYEHACHILGL